ncbi:MAG: c-type cytochrome [Alphaproteobacteria bacterium]
MKNKKDSRQEFQKDPLVKNKIVAAIILSGLVAAASGVVARLIYQSPKLVNQAFILPGSNETVASNVITVSGGDASGPGAIKDLYKTVSIEDGLVVARKCQACHGFDAGGAHRVGPNLYGIMGAPVAGIDGYVYSDSLVAVGGTWTEDKMNQWLYNPRSLASNTRMTFAGLLDDKERAAIILYMRSLR